MGAGFILTRIQVLPVTAALNVRGLAIQIYTLFFSSGATQKRALQRNFRRFSQNSQIRRSERTLQRVLDQLLPSKFTNQGSGAFLTPGSGIRHPE